MLSNDGEKETLAAITATFYGDERQQAFYRKFGEGMSGFPGIWHFCIEASDAFIAEENEVQNDNNLEWIDAIDSYVDKLLSLDDVMGGNNRATKLRELAKESLLNAGAEF